jgi:predicted nucleic acid-binding protein
MKYLLDVNLLLAAVVQIHTHNGRVVRWLDSLPAKAEVLLCPWVEIGAMRVGMQAGYFSGIEIARDFTARFRPGKATLRRVADDSHAAQLPAWVKSPRQMADGHLAALARAVGASLATLDGGIPGAFMLP